MPGPAWVFCPGCQGWGTLSPPIYSGTGLLLGRPAFSSRELQLVGGDELDEGPLGGGARLAGVDIAWGAGQSCPATAHTHRAQGRACGQ